MASVAKVLTFHLPAEQIGPLLENFDRHLSPRYTEHPGFRGLLCLELGERASRSQIYVVALWEDDAAADSGDLSDRWWDDASEALGIGIARHRCRVLRDVPGEPPHGP